MNAGRMQVHQFMGWLRWQLSEEAAQASGVRNAQAMFSAFVVLVSMVGAGTVVLAAWLAR